MVAACRPVSDALAAGLEAVQRHLGSSRKPWKMPMALDPPPMQAHDGVRQSPGLSQDLRAGLLTDDFWK